MATERRSAGNPAAADLLPLLPPRPSSSPPPPSTPTPPNTNRLLPSTPTSTEQRPSRQDPHHSPREDLDKDGMAGGQGEAARSVWRGSLLLPRFGNPQGQWLVATDPALAYKVGDVLMAASSPPSGRTWSSSNCWISLIQQKEDKGFMEEALVLGSSVGRTDLLPVGYRLQNSHEVNQ